MLIPKKYKNICNIGIIDGFFFFFWLMPRRIYGEEKDKLQVIMLI